MARHLAPLCALVLALAGCGDDGGPPATPDGGRPDANRPDAAAVDSATADAGADAGGMECAGVMCGAFEFCDRGMCRAYRGCVAQSQCDASEICLHRFCIPRDADPDGDGSPAGEDCDETNPDINPDLPEACNGIDDNCNDEADEEDPADMCEVLGMGGICLGGSCSCPVNTFDLDPAVPGCECRAEPSVDQGNSCAEAIDLGDLDDTGQMMPVSGNVLPDDREVWYRFRGVDTADSACDTYHVRVQFTTNPADTFEFTVFRGGCSTAACADEGYDDFNWATDFRDMATMPFSGQCPCTPTGSTLNVSPCADDTAAYLIRVRRKPGSTLSCDGFTLELSNGVYETP